MSFSFKDLFSDFLSEDVISVFSVVTVKACHLDRQKRTLVLHMHSPVYINRSWQTALYKGLKARFELTGFDYSLTYDSSSFCEEACRDIVEMLRLRNPVLNGYFADADYDIGGDSVTISLHYGGLAAITSVQFEKMFCDTVKQRFSKTVSLAFEGQTQDFELDLPEPSVQETHAFAPSPLEMPTETVDESLDFSQLPDFLLDITPFYGRRIDSHFVALNAIVPPGESGEKIQLSGWGEVFDYEERTISTKRGQRIVVTFCVSDRTNSIYCKLFMEPEKMEQIKPVKNGAILVFSGHYSFDQFTHDYVLEPRAMATAKIAKETDDAPQKRIELHCHTNMSANDAVASAESLIAQAYEWGHKAIAITDHGVVQSYPAAAGAVKKIRKSGGAFKVIYGVESYFVDDTDLDLSKLTARQIARYRYHQIILVKNMTGLKNLYTLVSEAHLHDFKGHPLTLKSKLDKLREGLILGSACEQGQLYRAILHGESDEELMRIAQYYDYLEIQPLGNNEFMIRDSVKPDKVDKKTGAVIPNEFKAVKDKNTLINYNRKVVEIADRLGLPVVATGDVHFLHKEDAIIRKVIQAGKGYDDFDLQAPLYLKTTTEMLEDFSYFGDRAKEFVVDNPARIADMIDDNIIPVPEEPHPPVIEGSDEMLRDICWANAHAKYGDKLPKVVEDRLKTELDAIINNGFSIMYISAQKLVSYSEENGYLVGSRGSVGSSFVATMAGISEVNPLPPHYVCPKCHYSHFYEDGSVGSGFDLPEKACPECGTMLLRDGHDIPFATFLGFKGDKVPDIDLNFSDEFQTSVQKYTETLFGAENVFKAGTISTIAEKTAYGFSKAYAEKKGIVLSGAELNRLAKLVENSKVKTTTGQHPAGMIVVPKSNTIYDFCPVQHPADDVNSDVITTHFDFHSIHDTILKLDELGHVIPTTYKYLEEYSGISVNDVSMSDPLVMSLFCSTEALGVTPEDIDSKTGTYCIPEFGTPFVREMLLDCKPKTFADLLQISGLSHGTDVWLGNAKDLIDKGICTISEVIGTRDNIMMYLIHKGMSESRAFKITETVRKGLVAKGKVSKEEWAAMEEDMRAVGVPEWYIGSCYKIKYMFPKAHAAAYVISALRVAWYKVHKPLEFYCAYFTARPGDVDISVILRGREAVRSTIRDIKAKGREASPKELAVLDNLYIFNEIMARGIEILPVDLKHSHAVKYLPENGKMRLPFGSIPGTGDKAAYAVYETARKGDYLSVEDFQQQSGVTKAVIQSLADMGVFSEIPDTNQMSMF